MAGTGLRCWALLTDNFFSLFSRSFLSQTKAQIKIKMTNPVKLPPSALNAGEPMTKVDFPGGSLLVVLYEFNCQLTMCQMVHHLLPAQYFRTVKQVETNSGPAKPATMLKTARF